MKTRVSRWLGLVAGAAMVTSVCGGDAPDLTQEERTRLEKDGVCISGDPVGLGMCEVYLNSSCVFITSDSVLALFHGMMRKTMLRRDAALARLLETELKRCANKLDGMNPVEPGAEPATCKAAMIRAKIVCGTAIRLLDPDWHAADPTINREIEAETARVEAAHDCVKPSWLGESEPMFRGINYSNYKPVGLHEETGGGKRYFRAVRFLQTIPFRLSRKEELYSACYILRSSEDPDQPGVFQLVFKSNFSIGRPAIQASIWALYGSLDVRPGTPTLQGMLGESMAYHRDEMDRPAPPALINNLIADVSMPASEEDSRMISPLFTPDSLVFQQVQNEFVGANEVPDPLLAAAWLGDMQAKILMIRKYPGCEKLLFGKSAHVPFRTGRKSKPLFEAYDDALRTLMSGPEAGAPDFMSKDAWHLKTRQTVLGSWARMRNCFALEAPSGRGIGGVPDDSPGFVEPCPEFYQKLGVIAGEMERTSTDWDNYDNSQPPASVSHAPADSSPTAKAASPAIRISRSDWSAFSLLCFRLEAMAHKQLRGIAWNDADRRLLGEYGLWFLNQCDEFPRAAAVSQAATGRTLIAAAGPTRVIWVNYPWKGKSVLCRGGVMTFYSFTAPGPVTDDEWQKRLQASPPPEPPDWLAPLGLMPVKAPKEN